MAAHPDPAERAQRRFRTSLVLLALVAAAVAGCGESPEAGEALPIPGPTEPPTCPPEGASACVLASAELSSLRSTALRCLVRFSDATQDHGAGDFGTRDAEWKEYSPTAYCIGGHEVTIAEPRNALSSFAFDQVACDCTEVGQAYVAQAAANLGFDRRIFVKETIRNECN